MDESIPLPPGGILNIDFGPMVRALSGLNEAALRLSYLSGFRDGAVAAAIVLILGILIYRGKK